ncbi:acetylcholinesterase-like, partial [Bombus impatiens]|uniref:Acetylcholinesterase-like n=1 Tax=Bombus impatiens TaxID=132113 RepID=A0A6P3DXJ0_BOMIM
SRRQGESAPELPVGCAYTVEPPAVGKVSIIEESSLLTNKLFLLQYTNWEDPYNGYIYQNMVADVVGDYFFICPSIHFAQLFAERGMKVYYYFFTQRTSTNLWGEWMGVMHGDEVEYVFGHPLNLTLEYTEKERDLSLRMILYFSKFAYSGKPTDEEADWPPYSRDRPQYYILNAQENGLGKGPHTTYCAFWNDFLPKLKGVPDVTPKACNSAIASSVSAGAEDLGNSLAITALSSILVLSRVI